MNNKELLIVSLIISIIAAIGHAKSSKNADKEIHIKSKFYPMHYMIPPRWLRKMFSLTKKEMAKFLVWQFYFSIVSIAVGIVNVVLLLINFSGSVFIVKHLIFLQICLELIDAIVFAVLLRKFKQR